MPGPVELRHLTPKSANREAGPLLKDIGKTCNEIFQDFRSERVYNGNTDLTNIPLSKVHVGTLEHLKTTAETRESSRGKYALAFLISTVILVATAIIGAHYYQPLEVASGLVGGFCAILFCVFLGLKLLARDDKKKLEEELERVKDMRQLYYIAQGFGTKAVQKEHLIQIRNICQKWNLSSPLLSDVNRAIALYPSELLK